MNLLRLENASLAFGEAPLLDRVNLSIDQGDRICLIGRNGTGKSSLIKVLARQHSLDSGTIWCSPACRIGYLEQSLPARDDLTVADVVASGLADVQALREEHAQLIAQDLDAAKMERLERVSQSIEELDGWQLENKVERILSRLSLDGSQVLSSLSGGWRRRVSLAKALVVEPNLLLLDEPTNHLDILAIEWLEQQLLAYNGALVFITHDRSFLNTLANRIIELDRGVLQSFPGSYAKFTEYREQQLTEEARHNALFDKKLAQEETWIRQGIKARRTRNEGRVRALEQLRFARSQRRNRLSTARMEVATGQDSGKIVCELQGISHGFDQRPLFQNFDYTVLKGDRIGFIGANGVGKSTLIRVMLGEEAPNAGKIKSGTRTSVAYFDQLRNQLDLSASVMDNLAQGRESIEINGRNKHVMGYLGDFLFSPTRVRSPVSSLSGGERNRLLLAKLFSQPANVLVLDEPTNDLDIETLELLEELLIDYQGTVLLVSHDRAFLDRVVTSCLVFDGQGGIEESVGGYQDWYNRGGRLLPQQVEGVTAKRTITDVRQADSKPYTKAGISSHAQDAGNSANKPVKLSYKVQRELDQLPELIESLETKLTNLQTAISQPDLYTLPHEEVTSKLAELAETEISLEAAMERWIEIEAMMAVPSG